MIKLNQNAIEYAGNLGQKDFVLDVTEYKT